MDYINLSRGEVPDIGLLGRSWVKGQGTKVRDLEGGVERSKGQRKVDSFETGRKFGWRLR